MKQSVRLRLMGGFGLLVLLMIIMQGIGYRSIQTLSESSKNLIDKDVVKLVSVEEYEKHIIQQVMYMRDYLTSGTESNVNKYNFSVAAAKEDFASIEKLVTTEGGKKLLSGAKTGEAELHTIFDQATAVKKAGNDSELSRIMAQGTAKAEELFSTLYALRIQSENVMEQSNESSEQKAMAYARLSLILLCTGAVLSVIIGWLTANSISKPLKQLETSFRKMAECDLTIEEVQVKRNQVKEISNLSASFNSMLANLRNVISQVLESSSSIAGSSRDLTAVSETTAVTTEQITASIQQVALGAEQQRNDVAEVTGTLSELAAGTEQTAVNMQNIMNKVDIVNKMSADGKNNLTSVINQMNTIGQISKESVATVTRLSDKSRNIESIVGIITNIAAQTNLLALNATIEAARAGAQGKGFSVVAEEIRMLAEQSSAATQKITKIVKQMQAEVAGVISSIQNEGKSIHEGVEKVNQANASFENIITGFDEINGQIEEVSALTQQMSAETEQVVSTVKSLLDISAKNAEISEEVSASSEEQASAAEEITASVTTLAGLSEHLLELVSKFKISC